MAQHDYNLANQNGAAFRADLNAALEAIQSVNSGATEPASTVAYMLWADTNAGILKMRNATDDGWVEVIALDATALEVANNLSDIGNAVTAFNNIKQLATEITAGVVPFLFDKYIAGLLPELAADADHDITINPGVAVASNSAVSMRLDSAITKQIDATWAEGNDAGGLFSGTVAAGTTYHLFIIENDSTGVIDAGFDTSLTAANIPAGYTNYRRVASFLTDSSANIISFSSAETNGGGVRYKYNDNIIDIDDSTPSTVALSVAMSVPSDVVHEILVGSFLQDNTAVVNINVGEVSMTMNPPSPSVGNLTSRINGASGIFPVVSELSILTDTSSQIKYRSDTASVTAFRVWTKGYQDFRRA